MCSPPSTDLSPAGALTPSTDLHLSCDELQLYQNGRLVERVAIVGVGSVAAEITGRHGAGRVIAVFDRSFYIQCDTDVVCVAMASLGAGPLHVLLDTDWQEESEHLRLRQADFWQEDRGQEDRGQEDRGQEDRGQEDRGQEGRGQEGRGQENTRRKQWLKDAFSLRISVGITVSLEKLLPEADALNEQNSAQGVCAVSTARRIPYCGQIMGRVFTDFERQFMQRRLLSVEPPEQSGFGWVLAVSDWRRQNPSCLPVQPGCSRLESSLRQRGFAAMVYLFQWLARSLAQPAQQGHTPGTQIAGHDNDCAARAPEMQHCIELQVCDLLGAGPGLTPAGDDTLAGAMLALHAVGRVELAGQLWRLLEPQLLTKTHLISAAHLRLAAQGQCAAPVLELLDAVFSDSRVDEWNDASVEAETISARANRIGASSGWDMLAGMSLVLRAC